MKFLHIADLHLGKVLNDVSFLPDQQHVLDQVVAIARDERADAVLIAGDVYQKASPPSEAMALFDQFVSRLKALGVHVFVISGNHDSSQRISYLSSLIRDAGVFVSERFEGRLQQFSLADEYGEIVIHLLPFLKPIQVRRWLTEEKITTYQEAVQAVLRASPIDQSKRNVLLCHQFITGSETSDSEEKAVGGLDNIDASVFDAFDYVALGHIHKPQCLMRDTLRYAGSLLKYSFSEVAHKKSVTLVTMQEKGNTAIRAIPLSPLRDMRLVDGMLNELLLLPYCEDYVWVTIHDELAPPDAKLSLTTVFPNMMKFSVSNSRTKTDVDVLAHEAMENKSIAELFSDFFMLQNNGQAPGEAHMKLLQKALKELEDERHETH